VRPHLCIFTTPSFSFVTWVGDHSPRHVHVCRDGRIPVVERTVKWDLDRGQAMEGAAPVRELLAEFVEEGPLWTDRDFCPAALPHRDPCVLPPRA